MPLHLSPRPVRVLRYALLALVLDIFAGVAARRGRAYLYTAVILFAVIGRLAVQVEPAGMCPVERWTFTPANG